jgi:hypothetical protein
MTIKRLAAAALLAVVAVLSVSACATPDYDRYSGICVDNNTGVRMPDDYCPIGDGPLPVGYHFGWAYGGYHSYDDHFDAPYVGQVVDRRVFVTQRPAKVSTLYIVRGVPARPAAGQPLTSTARVVTPEAAAKKAPTPGITRGGLGSTSVGKSASPPKAMPSAPAKRPVSSFARTTTKSGKR